MEDVPCSSAMFDYLRVIHYVYIYIHIAIHIYIYIYSIYIYMIHAISYLFQIYFGVLRIEDGHCFHALRSELTLGRHLELGLLPCRGGAKLHPQPPLTPVTPKNRWLILVDECS